MNPRNLSDKADRQNTETSGTCSDPRGLPHAELLQKPGYQWASAVTEVERVNALISCARRHGLGVIQRLLNEKKWAGGNDFKRAEASSDKSIPIRAPVISKVFQPWRELRREVIVEITAYVRPDYLLFLPRIFDTFHCSGNLFSRTKPPFSVSCFRTELQGEHSWRTPVKDLFWICHDFKSSDTPETLQVSTRINARYMLIYI